MIENYYRLLIVSHNCFSLEDSNGRTLAGLVKGWPKEMIAQFYTYNQIPNSNVCDNFFRVTDKQALLSIITCPIIGKVDKNESVQKSETSRIKRKRYRNPLMMLIRDIVWNLGLWKGKNFKKWINEFNPEIILVQAGDATYSLKIATDLATKRNIPLIVYNSEGFYFKNNNYFISKGLTSWLYPLFIFSLRKQIRKTYKYASHIIYLNSQLQEDFNKYLVKPSSVIYNASDIEPNNCYRNNNENLKMSYLGNLGLNRYKTLIELASVIQRIKPNQKLDIYGNSPSQEVTFAFANVSTINYKGFVSYQDVKEVIKQSDILFHVESFDNFYVEDTKYGFSTKMADSLMSGKCFFLYAPKSLACSKYLIENIPECTASNIEELELKIKKIVENVEFRMECATRCLDLAKKNHSSDFVAKKFKNVVSNVMKL